MFDKRTLQITGEAGEAELVNGYSRLFISALKSVGVEVEGEFIDDCGLP